MQNLLPDTAASHERDFSLFEPQAHSRVRSRCPNRWQCRGREGHDGKQHRRRTERDRIHRADVERQRPDQPCRHSSRREAGDRADGNNLCPIRS